MGVESWFVDVTETHTSLLALVFFRSPTGEHSRVPASGAVLDGASLPASTVDRSRGADAELCTRAGYVALRRIADFFDIRHNPTRTGRRSRSRSTGASSTGLPAAGRGRVPLKDDLDQAPRDFAGPGPDWAARRSLTCRAPEHSSWNGRRQGWAWTH